MSGRWMRKADLLEYRDNGISTYVYSGIFAHDQQNSVEFALAKLLSCDFNNETT